MQRTKQKNDQSKLTTKPPQAGARRYQKGIFPAYDSEYSRLASRSPILGNASGRDFKNAFAGTGLGECKRDLIQLVGGDEGKYKEEGTWYTALIPAAKNSLKEVFVDFKRWRVQQVQAGHALKPPKTWPDGLLQERLKAEARLDVRLAEKSFLENRIEEIKKRGKQERKEPMLPDGPVGQFVGGSSGKGKIKSVDGQSISFSPSGIPYISETDSPYDGMTVVDYRTMSKQWMEENRIRNSDLHERKNEFKAKAKEQGCELPVMFTKRKFEAMIKGETTFDGQDSWPEFEPWPENPEWPDEAKPITEIEELATVGS